MRITRKSFAIAALSISYAIAMFHRTSFSEFASELEKGAGITGAELGWVGSSFFWMYLLFQIPVGVMVDAAGSRRMAIFGGVMMAIGSAMFSVSFSSVGFAVSRAIVAVGAISVFLSLLAYCSKNYNGHANSALGRSLFVGSLGGIAAGLPLAYLLTVLPWRDSSLVLSGVSLSTVIAILLLIDREEKTESIRQALRHTLPAFLKSMHKSDVYLGVGAMAGLAGAFHAFSAYGIHQIGVLSGMSSKLEGIYVSVMMGGFAIGALVLGRLGDEPLMRNRIVKSAPVIAAVLWLFLIFNKPTSDYNFGVLLFAIGFVCAGFGCIYSMLDQLTVKDAQNAVKAAANCGIAFGAALSQMTQGFLPPKYAGIPCLALSIVGIFCCWIIAHKARKMDAVTEPELDICLKADPALNVAPVMVAPAIAQESTGNTLETNSLLVGSR